MKYWVFLSMFLLGCTSENESLILDLKDFKTGFEINPNSTATYEETIEFYKELAVRTPMVQVSKIGSTDSGKPLHAVVISTSGFKPELIRNDNKSILFINNAIHPGEPCGVDASMMLARDIFSDSLSYILDKVSIVIIPIYNVGGSLNRGSFSRANQIGPESYGFRGNSRNLDLNRDFIKADSYNALSFSKVFSKYSPDVFIDNHTSNGADYQYKLTLIASQKDKLTPELSSLMTGNMLPNLYQRMSVSGYEMTPYVYSRSTPDGGIYGFMDYPRYSSGYAALHNCIGLISEAHMLKPYQDRVWGTYHLMKNLLHFMAENNGEIMKTKKETIENVIAKDSFALDWTLDMSRIDSLRFKGFEAKYKPSEVTGVNRLYYDRNAPYEKTIPYYNSYKPTVKVKKPLAYIIPQAYKNIVYRLKLNGVVLDSLMTDQELDVEQYYIDDFETRKNPYEGHYLHTNVQLKKVERKWKFNKGDYIIKTNQPLNRLIVETLEPQGADSYFAWNFFDGILMQKEYFSSYVFEDTAADLLEEDAELKKSFTDKKNQDEDFANDPRAQLNYIYERSPYYEPTHMLYPVARQIK